MLIFGFLPRVRLAAHGADLPEGRPPSGSPSCRPDRLRPVSDQREPGEVPHCTCPQVVDRDPGVWGDTPVACSCSTTIRSRFSRRSHPRGHTFEQDRFDLFSDKQAVARTQTWADLRARRSRKRPDQEPPIDELAAQVYRHTRATWLVFLSPSTPAVSRLLGRSPTRPGGAKRSAPATLRGARWRPYSAGGAVAAREAELDHPDPASPCPEDARGDTQAHGRRVRRPA